MNNYSHEMLVLEKKIIKLINNLKENHLMLNQLKTQLSDLKTIEKSLSTKLNILKNQNHSLQIANNLLGGVEGKNITKTKINRLIKQVEDCIIHITEIKNDEP
ncbi:MAG: hypothetical protein CMC04_10125 [Flavobacteriaceae bacterium]|nr:hypothetical protein [Flavobacteriaceae bacterium]